MYNTLDLVQLTVLPLSPLCELLCEKLPVVSLACTLLWIVCFMFIFICSVALLVCKEFYNDPVC